MQTAVQSSISNTAFDKTDTRIAKRYIRVGYFIITLFFGSVVAWAAVAPISSAAIAPGLVSKDGYRKTVQHLEGGIIHNIFVKDGDKVAADQELIELDNIQSRADYDLMRKQKLIALVKEASLLAESRNENKFVLPQGIDLESVDDPVRTAIEGQIDAFSVRTDLHINQLEIIDKRIQQANVKISALRNERRTLRNEDLIIKQEIEEYEAFKERGLVTRAQVFALKRDQASNETDMTSNRVAIESTHQEINNLNMEKSALVASYTKRIVSDLDSVRDQLIDINEKLAKTEDRLERTMIRAPIEGVIVDLKVNTIGGVVKSGEPLLDIVPEEGKLAIDVQIDPKDRDTVRVGQDAEVRFTAFNQRITTPVKGKVVLISADRLVDSAPDGTQSAYYKAKVELLEDPSKVMNGSSVYPGMQADVMIITGKRTAMGYFLKPVIKSFNRAFRDD
jgi:HlyD family type I secretion membrane fusion protein